MKKQLLLMLKIGFALGAVYLIFTQIEVEALLGYLKEVDPVWIFCSFLLLNLAHIFASIRQKYYFSKVDCHISLLYSIKLTYVGVLFNQLLPGGLSGDGYKAWYMKKHENMPWPVGIRQMLSNRANGLVWLFILTGVLCLFSPKITNEPFAVPLILAGLVAVVVAYSLAAKLLLKEPVEYQLKASPCSFAVQFSILISSYTVLMSLGQETLLIDYMILFMLSCIAVIIPISIGSLGLRELTFLYGSAFLGLDKELGVLVAMLFFVITLATAVIGLVWFFAMKPSNIDKAELETLEAEKEVL